MGRPEYSQDQVDAIQAEICAHAISVFRNEGIRGLTLRAVAKRMGWTATALYRYFKDKNELLAVIRAEGFVRIEARLAHARAGASNPADAARRAMRAYLGFALEEPEFFQLMYQLDQGEAPSAPEVRAERERAFSHARAIGADAVRAGLLPGDANLAAHVFWAGCHGLATLAIAEQLDLGCSYEELIEPLLERLTAPLAPGSATTTTTSNGAGAGSVT